MLRLLPYVLFVLFLILVVRFITFDASLLSFPEASPVTFTASLTTTPKIYGGTQSFLLQPQGYESVSITTASYPAFHYGQELRVAGTVDKKMLENEKIVRTMYFPHIEPLKDQSVLYELRSIIRESFEATLPQDEARLLMGIVFGIKEPLSTGFQEQIQEVGLLHVIAASGMNITLLIAGLVLLLERFFTRRMTLYITLVAILLYAGFAGFQPSIVRASLMGGAAVTAALLGRQYFGLWMLGITGYIMLLFDPLLISNVGFQLSFLATIGIIIIKPVFDSFFSKKIHLFEEDTTTTVAAQIMTIPIILGAFGQFNLISIPANAAILWMVSPLMILGGIAALLSLISQSLAAYVLYLCLPFLWLFKTMTAFFSQFHLTIQVESFSLFATVVYFLFVFWILFLIKGRARRIKAQSKGKE